MLSTKDLAFKERPARKLVDQYIGLYTIEEMVSTNVVKLQLSTSIRIYLVVNVSWIVQYREQVEEQKKEEIKLIEVEDIKEQKVEKILNKRKVQKIEKYLVQQKGFIAKHDTWERKEDLENAREAVEEFKERMSAKVRRQEKLDMIEEKDFRKRVIRKVYSKNVVWVGQQKI